MIEQWNSVVKEWNSVGGTAWYSVGGTVWWNSGTVEQCWVNSVVEQ